MTAALLGIDIGTSGCKALLIGTDGTAIAAETATYPLAQPRPGWTEQDPALWIEGARQAVAGALGKAGPVEILCVGLSGQMHGLTPLDAGHRALRPAILWNDQRNGAECAGITEAAGGPEALRAITNNRMLVGYTGGKILWMRNHEPELFRRMAVALNPKDYLRLVLTGEVASEVSDASGTGLFDVRARRWAAGLAETVGIDPGLLPPVFESREITGRISAAGAALFGLPEGLPVAGGGGDSVIQTIGSGVIAPGELQTTIGTAGILAAALDAPEDNPDGRLQVFCNVAPDKWHCMGVSLNAGGALAWFRDAACRAASGEAPSFEAIAGEAGESPAGARGLLFLPYLNGERCPHPDPTARGAFAGLTARHDRGDMARSVMEGVVHAFGDMHALMRTMGIEGRIIKASGGGARSALWRQMQADFFGCDVVTTEGAAEGAAFGAALVAGLAVGVWPDAAAAAASCRPLTRETPDGAATALYARAHEIYRALYPALSPAFAGLGDPAFDA
ncbi:xylulokinase [Amaricoccus sp.]|uniref:xylulokinase n=1 Tax=Amaricoccus sp. TaxID=1872485 RepID=UPI001B4CBF07|nr:xylulokinase [Amaricoccus sp.]MBP7002220.1 xylulokinase [Amaricoccus sp.]